METPCGSATASSSSLSSSHARPTGSDDDDDDNIDQPTVKRLKRVHGFGEEEEAGNKKEAHHDTDRQDRDEAMDALRAALDAAREEAQAAREGERAAREGERAAREEVKAVREDARMAREEAREARDSMKEGSRPSALELAAMEKGRGRAWRKKHGFDPDDPRATATKFDMELTPMIYACHLGDLEMCRIHFNHGAADDIRTVDSNGSTPMHFACKNGHLSVCEWLYKVGATEDIRTVTNGGNTHTAFS